MTVRAGEGGEEQAGGTRVLHRFRLRAQKQGCVLRLEKEARGWWHNPLQGRWRTEGGAAGPAPRRQRPAGERAARVWLAARMVEWC